MGLGLGLGLELGLGFGFRTVPRAPLWERRLGEWMEGGGRKLQMGRGGRKRGGEGERCGGGSLGAPVDPLQEAGDERIGLAEPWHGQVVGDLLAEQLLD